MTAGILGAEEVSIKKALKDEKTAFSIFCKELEAYKADDETNRVLVLLICQ